MLCWLPLAWLFHREVGVIQLFHVLHLWRVIHSVFSWLSLLVKKSLELVHSLQLWLPGASSCVCPVTETEARGCGSCDRLPALSIFQTYKCLACVRTPFLSVVG